MAKDYFIDSDDEAMYLEMLEGMDFDTAMDTYTTIKDEVLNKYLSGSARGKTFAQLTYKNLRYLILGCENCSAEARVKALATFIYRASMPTRLNALVSNDHLMRMLHANLEKAMPQIYKWANVEYSEKL